LGTFVPNSQTKITLHPRRVLERLHGPYVQLSRRTKGKITTHYENLVGRAKKKAALTKKKKIIKPDA